MRWWAGEVRGVEAAAHTVGKAREEWRDERLKSMPGLRAAGKA